MPNIDCPIDSISQHINDSNPGDNVYFSTIDLKHAYSQINCIRIPLATVIQILFVVNRLVHTILKRGFMVLLICRQSFKRPWIAHWLV